MRRKRKRLKMHQPSRYLEIIRILSKYGFSELARDWHLFERFRLPRRIIPENTRKRLIGSSRWEKVRLMLAELGPTFIKLGQLMSNRQDILPQALIKELEILQDEAPPFPGAEAIRIIEQELQSPVSGLYKTFVIQPIAAASIAQVHEATLFTGEKVAVKIKRPGIDEKVKRDLAIMHRLSHYIDKHLFADKPIQFRSIIEEFENKITDELNFKNELLNAAKFAAYFKNEPFVVIPKTFKKYSGKAVLTMEFIEGIKVSRLYVQNGKRIPGYDSILIAHRTARFVATQLLIHGFFHADPHPGNFLVLEHNVICFIDYGIMSSISPDQQYQLNTIILGLVLRNMDFLARAVLKLTAVQDMSQLDTGLFRQELFKYKEKYLDVPLADLNMVEVLLKLLNLLQHFKLKIPASLTYMLKSLATLESIGSQLDPDFNLFQIFNEFSPQILAHMADLNKIRDTFYLSFLDYTELIQELPEAVTAVHRFFNNRQLNLAFTGQNRFQELLDKISFRVVNGLILSALLISSALVIYASRTNGISMIGIIGFIISGVMGFALLIDGLIKFFRWKYKE